MKRILFIYLLLFGHKSFSQKFFTSFFAGTSNYQGDLTEKLYDPKHTHLAWGLGFMFELNEHMLIRAEFTSGKISGSDASGSKNISRNLYFYSSISEFTLGYEYVLLDLYQYKVSPYVFAGVSVFKFAPYAKDENGYPVSLYELDTEGQGFYDGRKKYKLSQFVIPYGGGVQWAISDNARIGFVIGIRQTFTDYLDDVSKTYVDKNTLIHNRGANAVKYAYRGSELPNAAPYPADGTPRGNPSNKDWYYFSGLTLRVRIPNIRGRKAQVYRSEKSRVTCPKPVW
ncbi:MAG: hypothetical protein JST81_00520 [Bacteroidetes bacterium]|nr:hypothetical protein [Bacteroidota bacterium]